MGIDQIAAIHPLVFEVQEAYALDPSDDFCASFKINGRESAWVQVMIDMINFAYPFSDDPDRKIRELAIPPPIGWKLVHWKPNLFATFSIESTASCREISECVDKIFERLLNSGPDYPLDCSIQRLSL